jgi:hypothetical protein
MKPAFSFGTKNSIVHIAIINKKLFTTQKSTTMIFNKWIMRMRVEKKKEHSMK